MKLQITILISTCILNKFVESAIINTNDICKSNDTCKDALDCCGSATKDAKMLNICFKKDKTLWSNVNNNNLYWNFACPKPIIY